MPELNERGSYISKMTVMDEMLTLEEAAELSGYNSVTLRGWVTQGKLPAARFRHTYVISKVVLAMTVAATIGKTEDDIPSPEMIIEQLLTPAQVARVLKVSRQRIDQLIVNGQLESVRFGQKLVRVSQDALNKYIEMRTTSEPTVRRQKIADFMTTEEVAEQLRVSIISVRGMLERKELSGTKVGIQWRIPRESLNSYLKRRTTKVNPRERMTAIPVGKKFRKVSYTKCATCQQDYIRNEYAEHLQDAEHIRTRGWKSGLGRV